MCCAATLPPFPTGEVLAPLVSVLPLEVRPALEGFISRCLTVFGDLDATLLEMNPFTLEPASGQVGGRTRPSRGRRELRTGAVVSQLLTFQLHALVQGASSAC